MKRVLLSLLLSCSAAVHLTAQNSEIPTESVPELFAGELDDVGPQYLLLAQPRRQAWQLWASLDLTATSNVTLVETDASSSTLTVAQAGLTYRSSRHSLAGGTWGWEVGPQGQAYRYGFLSGQKQKINLVEIDRNNFDLGGLHARVDWQRGPWFASLGVRAASLRSNATDHTFYEEVATEWALFWQKSLPPSRTLAIGFDGAARFSRTDSFGLLPYNWNNRVEQSVTVLLDQSIGTHWNLRPSIRYSVSTYTAAERNRLDQQIGTRLSLSRDCGRHANISLNAGYDRRESTDPVVADFEKWDLGGGISMQWKF